MFDFFKSLDRLFMSISFAEAGEMETAAQLMENEGSWSDHAIRQKRKTDKRTIISPKAVVYPT